MFGVFGFFFPAGLVLYWTTSNAWQIGQQYFMLKNRLTAEDLAARAGDQKKSEKKGFLASMTERAEEDRKRRAGTSRSGQRKPGSAKQGPRKSSDASPGLGEDPGSGRAGSKPKQVPPKKPSPGAEGGTGDRKKRPKR